MVQGERMTVDLIYIKPGCQNSESLALPSGSTIRQVIAYSGLLQRFPEIDLAVNKVGVFSHIKALDHVLEKGDRIEIYRPLLIDPKEARHRRAKIQQ